MLHPKGYDGCMAILFVSGVNDQSTIGVNLDNKGNLAQLLDGNCSVHGMLPLKEDVAGFMVLFGKGVQQAGVDFVRVPSLIFNQISDADTHRGSLERCVELCSQVQTMVINQPQHVLQTTRDHVAELLQEIPGVIVPKTVRFQPRSPGDVFEHAETEGFEFPFITRLAGEHSGKSMILLAGPEDLDSLHALPFDGRDFYLSQFIDCKDSSGLYHKQRIVVIDGEPILRHSLFNEYWKIHASSREFMMARESWDDDNRRMQRLETEVIPALKPAITEIKNRLKLEYFGLDCNLRPDGKMVVFEANANMNVLYNPYPEMNDCLRTIHQKIQAMLTRYSGEAVI